MNKDKKLATELQNVLDPWLEKYEIAGLIVIGVDTDLKPFCTTFDTFHDDLPKEARKEYFITLLNSTIKGIENREE